MLRWKALAVAPSEEEERSPSVVASRVLRICFSSLVFSALTYFSPGFLLILMASGVANSLSLLPHQSLLRASMHCDCFLLPGEQLVSLALGSIEAE